MGCQAITPHLVSLAKRLEGRPFHLVASHCQRGTQSDVVNYIKSKGLAADTPNVTVTSMGGHPGVKGNGYVPYYMVFDHKGNLAHHHMCGAYHGGDGLEMIKWVDKLLLAAPAIYLGEEPFVEAKALADAVRARKGLASTIKKIEAARTTATGERKAEVERLYGLLASWRDNQVQSAEALAGSRPSAVLSELGDLAKELKGSALGLAVSDKLRALASSVSLNTSLKLEKIHDKVLRGIEKLKLPKGAKRRGLSSFDLKDPACRAFQVKALKRAADKLRKAVKDLVTTPMGKGEQFGPMPYVDHVQNTIQQLDG